MTFARMKKWTPALAQRWSFSRIARAKALLAEISYAWGDVDNNVVIECDRLLEQLDDLRESVAEATENELQRGESS